MVRAWKIISPKTTPYIHTVHAYIHGRLIDERANEWMNEWMHDWLDGGMRYILFEILKNRKLQQYMFPFFDSTTHALPCMLLFLSLSLALNLSPTHASASAVAATHDDKLNNCKTSIKNLLIVEIFLSLASALIRLLRLFGRGFRHFSFSCRCEQSELAVA